MSIVSVIFVLKIFLQKYKKRQGIANALTFLTTKNMFKSFRKKIYEIFNWTIIRL